jgi:hypothetical protein
MCTQTSLSRQGNVLPVIRLPCPHPGGNELKPSLMMPASSRTSLVTKRSVSFDQKVRMYTHIHIKDLSPKTIASIWYSRDAYWAMEKDAFITAEAKSLPLQRRWSTFRVESSKCLRGLESRTPDAAARRFRNKQRAWDAVLNEQDRQWDSATGIIDDEEIARAYIEVSHKHLINARILAIQDAIDVGTDPGCTKILTKTHSLSPSQLCRKSQSAPSLPNSTCTRAA